MSSMSGHSLGYVAAKQVLELGRSAFFGNAKFDLPQGRSPSIARDDRIPQFGYVGTRFTETRVLLLGINPGNGPRDVRNRGDKVQMPALHRFAKDRTPESFVEAQRAYREACQLFRMWRTHCAEIIGEGGLSLDEIAYSNCLPWRTASESRFDDNVAERAATLYAYPLIEELRPCVVKAIGKKAEFILTIPGPPWPPLITWNASLAATACVILERKSTATQLLSILKRCRAMRGRAT